MHSKPYTEYRLISKKGEGTFSEVFKAQSTVTSKYVAIKCMKGHFDSVDKVNSLREIQALRRLSPHPNIIKLIEVIYDEPTGRLALVFELMDMNVYEWIKNRRSFLPETKIRGYVFQLLKALEHSHSNGIFHRDIKPENVLLSGDKLKLADLGSCKSINSRHPYTEYISTRWYRSPECLLTDGYYGAKMDLWGVGCVLFEVVSLQPLFPGKNELDQIRKIHNILGTPPPEKLQEFQKHATHMEIKFPHKEGSGIDSLIPHASENCRDLIKKLLIYDEEARITASEALSHSYFRELREESTVLSVTPTISDSDFAAGEKEQKVHKKMFPVISKPVKNMSFSKITLTMDKSVGKNLPNLKQSSPYAKKGVFKGY